METGDMKELIELLKNTDYNYQKAGGDKKTDVIPFF